MLKIDLLAVGTRPPEWLRTGMASYVKRLGSKVEFTLHEIRTADRRKTQTVMQCKQAEAEALLAKRRPGAQLIALDASGQPWSTADLAARLASWEARTGRVQFLIGGPDGLHSQCITAADAVFSLSRLTFPHFVARLLLAEQLYRALMLNQGHPYHK